MDHKDLIQKYIDQELSDKDRLIAEKLLQSDAEAYRLYRSLMTEREELLILLETLNPKEIQSPEAISFVSGNKISTRLFLRAAAAMIILAGLTFALYLGLGTSSDEDNKVETIDFVNEELWDDELDYYISPNRCVSERKLVWTIIEIK